MAAQRWQTYFAYGSNMDVEQMRYRCPGAKVVGTGLLKQHRFIINRHGVASVVPDPTQCVYGVLWHITPAHEAVLDDYEGVDEGCYYKAQVDIETANASERALIYIASDSNPGKPRPQYMERIVVAALYHKLPPRYVEELRRWLDGV